MMLKKGSRQPAASTRVEESFRRVFEYAGSAMIILDFDRRTTLLANHQASSLLGYNSSDFRELALSELLSPGSEKIFLQNVDELRLLGRVEMNDAALRRSSGQLIPADIVFSTCMWQSLPAALMTIHPRKQAQRSSAETPLAFNSAVIEKFLSEIAKIDSEEQLNCVALHHILKILGMEFGAVFITDSNLSNPRLIDYIPRAEGRDVSRWQPTIDMTLIEEANLTKRMVVLTTPEAGKQLAPSKIFGSPLAAQVIMPLLVDDESLGVLALGSQNDDLAGRDHLVMASLLGYLLALNIKHLRLTQNLRQSQVLRDQTRRRQQQLLEGLHQGVILTNAQGQVTLYNEEAARLLGYPPHFAAGIMLAEVVPVSVAEEIAGYLQQPSAGLEEKELEFAVSLPGNHQLLLAAELAPLSGDEDDSKMILLFNKTESDRLSKEQQKINKLQVMAQISAVLAHEIRNPLSSIRAGVQYIASKVDPDSPLAKTAEAVIKESVRINGLMEDVLSISRKTPANLAPTSVTSAMENALLPLMGKANAKNIKVRTYLDRELPRVMGNSHRLEQVFSNLINNAIEAMDQNGQLTCRAYATANPLDIPIRALQQRLITARADHQQARKYIIAEVEDNGPGIPEEQREKVFEPFFTTKSKGTGLGLLVTQQIIAEHNAYIDILTAQKGGARFVIALPAETKG